MGLTVLASSRYGQGCFLWELQGKNLFLCFFQLPEAAQIPW